MPEAIVRGTLQAVARRLRVVAVADGAIAGSAMAGLIVVASGSRLAAAVGGVFTGIVLAWRRWRWSSPAEGARVLERLSPGSANLVVTAEEVIAGRAIHPTIARELFAQTAARLLELDDRPHRRAAWLRVATAAALVVSSALLLWRTPSVVPLRQAIANDTTESTPAEAAAMLRVTVVPPAYTRRPPAMLDNPVRVDAVEGSTIELQMPGVGDGVELVDAGGGSERFAVVDGNATHRLTATASRVLVIRRWSRSAPFDRLLQVQVQRDQRPTVAIDRPGRDLLFANPSGTVPVLVSAQDDFEVASVSLRYTKISGSGENFTFEEREIPIQLTAGASGGTMEGRASLVLERLALEDGDALVYRAVVRDRNPGADPSTSESYLIEIGASAEASAAGFAVPEERNRQALSQQMLIVKTERLHAQRSALAADAFLARSQLLAVEQRMVRAEFVFLMGGEVVDEVEEAAHALDLEQGRLENQGQIELLNATREMARAEARLNAADTAQALGYERAALAALQRAFDRRRYFLRTLPERTRIDTTRRLSGDTSTARPRAAAPPSLPAEAMVDELRHLLRELAAAARGQEPVDSALAARVVRLDPGAQELQELVAAVTAGERTEATTRAAERAQSHLRELLRTRLAASAASRLRRDPLAGAFTRLASGGRR